ncbi:hypothetical protein Tco_0739864 [Tanacetum coccineum]
MRSHVSVGYELYLKEVYDLLRTELEKVKQEKEGLDFKIAKFDKSAKDLDQLLESQITEKSKKGFGYNAVLSLSRGCDYVDQNFRLILFRYLKEFKELLREENDAPILRMGQRMEGEDGVFSLSWSQDLRKPKNWNG